MRASFVISSWYRSVVTMFLFVISLCIVGGLTAEYTLPGVCPDVKVQENLDFTKAIAAPDCQDVMSTDMTSDLQSMVPTVKFSGLWHHVGGYASDGRGIYDCATLDLQEDNMGYTLTETYVDVDGGNRTQKSYLARVDPMFDAGNSAQFIVSHEVGDKVLQFPFLILSTDYDGYAIAYFCKWLKEKERKHYVFTWILTRSKEKLQGDVLRKVEDTLSKYSELAEHRQAFVFKEFNDLTCAYTNKFETDFFTSNFW